MFSNQSFNVDLSGRESIQVRLSSDTARYSHHSDLENARRMRKIRPILAVALALFFYTVTDILVWQRIFEFHRLVEYADMYHTGWFVSLAGYATIGFVLLWGQWKDLLYYEVALGIGAFSGLEDVLYYVLDGREMPSSLPWLGSNPMIGSVSRSGVLTSVFFWLAIILLLYVGLYWMERKPRVGPRQDIESPAGEVNVTMQES